MVTTDSRTVIESKNVEVTEAIRDYANSKINRIYKHFENIIQSHQIRLLLSVVKSSKGSNQKAEITINLKGGHTVHCEDAEANVYAAIDLVVDKVEMQLRKEKSKKYKKSHREKVIQKLDNVDFMSMPNFLQEINSQDRENLDHDAQIDTKRFKMQALDPEQAVNKLDECGNPFFMFLNVYSNKIACVFHKDEEEYGLVEPEYLQVDN